MDVLGVSCFYHDSAACLWRDGRPVAAASEERFNRKKNSPAFPSRAINSCLQTGGVTSDDLDCVAFYEKPFLKFHRVISEHVESFPYSFKNFITVMPHWLRERLSMPFVFKEQLGCSKETLFVGHHLSHAASAFYPSPFEEAAILTADGVGEWATLSAGKGSGKKIVLSREMRFPNSLGLIYTAVTTYLGFEALRGEGKVMGLAGYGEPLYLDKLRKMIATFPDGSFLVDEKYFAFNGWSPMFTSEFVREMGPAREPEGAIEQRHRDIAASVQKLTEDILIAIAQHLHQETGLDRVCLAGGLFLNCVGNMKILENSGFKDVFIQPAAGDGGAALGAAAYVSHGLFGQARGPAMENAYLGPTSSVQQARRSFVVRELKYNEMEEDALCCRVARLLEQGKIVGWFQGRMEFGPRALGNRSILANPCKPEMKDILNLKVKKRESFRPFAPVVLQDRAAEFFFGPHFSPFMTVAVHVKPDKRHAIPAVTHVDGTARIQTLHREINPRLWRLISAFDELTGVPMLINTSFNLRGEPIVCSPEDAVDCYLRSGMDALVVDNLMAEKEN